MGLAGRKTKQRIGADPRNLSWSDDSSKFGAKYLQSLGWTSGTGLGVSGEGRTSNLKIHQKLDLMGIGADRRGHDGDDAGWRAGREFEGLLARLNQAQCTDTQDTPVDEGNVANKVDSAIEPSTGESERMTKGESPEVIDKPPETGTNGKKGKTGRKGDADHKKKRKRSTMMDEEDDVKGAKRRRKEDKRDKKEKRKAEKAAKKLETNHGSKSGPGEEASVALTKNVKGPVQDTEAGKVAPRYRAHRARNIASKRLAAVSATGMNEILGISSTGAGPIMETSSIPFPTLPLNQSKKGDEGHASASGIKLSPLSDPLNRPVGANRRDGIFTMGLGSHSAVSGGLGFGTAKETTTDFTQENGGNDQLRRSGKSVAEYFAERLRNKCIAKGAQEKIESIL